MNADERKLTQIGRQYLGLLISAALWCAANASADAATGGYRFPVKGMVYSDLNRNSARDIGEPPVSGIGVSDGYSVTLTDTNGGFLLPNADHLALFVYVCQPADAPKTDRGFYHLLNAATKEQEILLPVLPDDPALATRRDFTFVHITDVHTGPDEPEKARIDAFRQLERMRPRPDFILDTGDICGRNEAAFFKQYMADRKTARLTIPVFDMPGNHDMTGSKEKEKLSRESLLKRYAENVGPDRYSFDYGPFHVVVRDSWFATNTPFVAWFDQDRSLLGKNKIVIVVEHYPPKATVTADKHNSLEQLSALGVRLVIAGDSHSDHFLQYGNLQFINSPPFTLGGLDSSPAGFKIVTLDATGKAGYEFRRIGMNRHIAVSTVQPGGTIASDGALLVVNAYDCAVPPAGVAYSIRSVGRNLASGSLAVSGLIAWTGRLPPLPAGAAAELVITVTDLAGVTWPAHAVPVKIAAVPATSLKLDGDWPMFMGNPGRTGIAPGTGAARYRPAWNVNLGGDPDFSSPIAGGGRIYVAIKRRSTARAQGVVAIRPADGALLWRVPFAHGVDATPSYASGTVFAHDVTGDVKALNAADGAVRWERRLPLLQAAAWLSPSLYTGGTLYVNGFRSLYALDAASGSIRGEITDPERFNLIYCRGALAFARNSLLWSTVWTSKRIRLCALNTTDFSERWLLRGSGTYGGMAISGNLIFSLGEDGKMTCADLATGKEKWATSSYSGWSAATPAVHTDVVVVPTGVGKVIGFARTTGKKIWEFEAGRSLWTFRGRYEEPLGIFSSPTIAGARVYVGSSDGRLYILDVHTGKKIWSWDFGVPVLGTPLVSGNSLFVHAADGRLYAFQAEK